jgi:O-antigen ligase
MNSKEQLSLKILGTLWGAVPLSYWLIGDPVIIYALILFFYFAYSILYGIKRPTQNSILMLATVQFYLFISSFVDVENASFTPYITVTLFVVNLFFLLIIIDKSEIKVFLRYFFVTTSFFAFAHIILVLTGQIEDSNGRYLFFGNTHPNLGGEIYAVAAFAGAISLGKKAYLFYSLPFIVSSFYLQSRTGMTVVALTLIFRLFFTDKDKFQFRNLIVGTYITFFIVSILLSVSSIRIWLIERVLFFEDVNRGIGTGLVTGRDDRWAQAWDDFSKSPFFGNGLNWHSDGLNLSAHNPILFSLVYFGIFGFIFWVIITHSIIRIFLTQFQTFLLLSPNLIMILLNDRFLNSNAFPLLFYFCILKLSEPNKNYSRISFSKDLHLSNKENEAT